MEHNIQTDHAPQRGELWYADLESHPGSSVQGGCRPVLIISNNVGNAFAATLNVLPLTRQLKKLDLPCHTELDPHVILDRQQVMDVSMVLAEQITTISKSDLRNYVGKVEDENLLDAVNRAVSIQLGLVSLPRDNVRNQENESMKGAQYI